MSIARTTSPNSEPHEPQSNSSRPDRREEDFESFLLVPTPAQQPVPPPRDLSSRDEADDASSKAGETDDAQPHCVRPESPAPEKKLPRTTSSQADSSPQLPATKVSDLRGPLRVSGGTMKGPAFQPAETPAASAFAQGALGHGSIGPDGSVASLPALSKTSDGGSIPAEGSSAFPTLGILNADRLKNIFLTDDGQPIRPIEIELKGGDARSADPAAASPGLYPAGGLDLEPARIRVSFAEIADALRTDTDRSEVALTAGTAEIKPSEASGDGTTSFADSGNSQLTQAASLQNVGQTAAAGHARSLQQIEIEMLQLASAANLRNDGRSLKIRLDSGDLGSVEITLVRHEGGSMSAHLVTDTEGSRQALNENLIQLRNSLENAGLQLHELDISCRSFASGTFQGGREGRDGSQAGASPFHPAATNEAGGILEANSESDIRLLNLRA